MPRQARIISESGYYHVIIRGVGKQILFEEDSDYGYFLHILEKYSGDLGVKVCAYCLMSNHVHLLLYDVENNLSLLMKKIGISYSSFFNAKYERTGHLLQDRFLSEPICSERQLVAVFRYILCNPVKAGICKASEYRWNSYYSYVKRDSFVDVTIIESLIGGYDNYVQLIDAYNNEEGMEYSKPRISDDRAVELVKEVLGSDFKTYFSSDNKKIRNDAIVELKRQGLSVRQIERLTGVSKGVVQRA